MDFFKQNLTNLRQHSIRRQFFYLLIIGGLFFSTVLSLIVFYYIYSTEKDAWQGRQKEAALSASKTVASFMKTHEDTIEIIGLLNISYLESHPNLPKQVLAKSSGFVELVYLDKQGDVSVNISEEISLLTNSFTNLQSRWFQTTRNGEFYSGEVKIVSRDEPHLIIATPATDGVVAARLQMNVLWEVVANIEFGEQGKVYIVDGDGQIIAHTHRDVVLEMTSIADKPEFQQILQAQNHEWYGTYSNLDNQQVVATTAPIPNTDWIIVAELLQSEAFALTYRAISVLGTILLTFTVGSIVIFTRLVERFVFRPIDRLERGVQALSGGDLDYRIPIKQLDEIGMVAMGFNQMAEELGQLYDNLEQKVADRTRRLDLMATLSQQLTTLDLHDLLGNLVTQLQQTSGYSGVYVYLIDETSQDLKLFESANQQKVNGIKPNQEIIRQVIESSKPFMSNDLSQEAIKSSKPQTQSELAIPLKVPEKTLGVLDIHSTQTDFFTPADLSMIKSIAEQTAIAVKNAQLLAERQLTIKKLKQVDMKSRFITMMSHELRTPLNAINGFAELLTLGLSGELPEQVQQDVQLIHENGQHLLTLINDVLEITQLEAGWVSIKTQPLEPQPVIDDALAVLNLSIQEKSLEIVVDLPASLPLVEANHDYLKQIFLALVGNAIKFTPPDGRITITASQSVDHEFVQFSVIDTGIGIPADQLEIIFESFMQVDMSDAREYGGTGLGLSICKQLVELHQGQIHLKSQLCTGSEFYFTIPVAHPISQASSPQPDIVVSPP